MIKRPETDVRQAVRLADAFNLLLSFKDGVSVGGAVGRRVRGFLHRLLAVARTDEQRAAAVCALRGVGDAESVALIAALTPLRGCWAGLEQLAVREIRKRTRSATEPRRARRQPLPKRPRGIS